MPPEDGPWPVLFEQRYADIQGERTRRWAARLAQAGYVVAMVNDRPRGKLADLVARKLDTHRTSLPSLNPRILEPNTWWIRVLAYFIPLYDRQLVRLYESRVDR